jgi:pimeloyl-ACP methyl ester carboxylesterase
MFYKIIKPLAEKFHLILIDLIGMGGSSRPNFIAETADDSDKFFLDSLESWRQAMGDMKDFILAGHSFGGYICGQYAVKYPHHLKKLLLLSPVGVGIKPADFDMSKMRMGPNKKGPGKIGVYMGQKVWDNKWSPFGVMRKSGKLLGKKIIKGYLTKRMKDLPPEEFNDLHAYMYQIFMREGSTEYALFTCFQLGMFAVNALEAEDRLGNPEFPLAISFFHGDIDWTPREPMTRVLEKNKFNKTDSRFHIVSHSDHHMYMDNPAEFAQLIIDDIEGVSVSRELIFMENQHAIEEESKQEEEEDEDVFDVDPHMQAE